MTRRTLLCYLLTVIAGLFLWREDHNGSFDRADTLWSEWLAANTGISYGEAETTFIRFDDAEDAGLSEWPPGTGDYALLADHLAGYGSEVVAIHPTVSLSEGDLLGDSLAASLRKMPVVILGAVLENDPAEAGFVDPALAGVLEPFAQVVGDPSDLPAFTGIDSFPSAKVREAGLVAVSRIDPGVEWSIVEGSAGPELRVPLLARLGDQVVPSLLLRTAMAWRGVGSEDVEIQLGRSVRLGSIVIPIDPKGAMKVDPRHVGTLPDLLAGNVDPETAEFLVGTDTAADLETLRDNVLVVGIDCSESRIVDFAGDQFSAARLLALGVATIQANRHNPAPPLWVKWLPWAAAGIFSLCLPFVNGGRKIFFVSFLAFLAAVITSLIAFQTSSVWLPVSASFLTCLFAIIVHWLMPEERTRIRR